MTDPATIAKGLTHSQAAAMVAEWHQKPSGSIIPCPLPIRKALVRRGLAETAYGFATPTGFAVRRYLLEGQPA